MQEISPEQCAEYIQAGTHYLLDVREPHELQIAHIDGAIHIALSQFMAEYSNLPTDKPICVICHHGGRSARATQFLNETGYNAINVAGGIDQWAERLDPQMERY